MSKANTIYHFIFCSKLNNAFHKMLVYPQRIMAGYLSSWSKKAPVLSYEGIIYCWKMGRTKIFALISTFHEIYFAMEKFNRDLLLKFFIIHTIVRNKYFVLSIIFIIFLVYLTGKTLRIEEILTIWNENYNCSSIDSNENWFL